MKTEYIYSIISSILVILVIISIIIFILSKVPNQVEFDRQTQLTYDKCCNGNMCSDTYYSEKDNLCHSTFVYNLLTKWYFTIPLVFGVAIVLGLIVRVGSTKENIKRKRKKLKEKLQESKK